MSILGKFHEVSFYGLITTIVLLIIGKTSVTELWNTKFQVTSFSTFFLSFLFWCCVLYIPIAIIGAYSTKYSDDGEGLTFKSDNLLVIMFSHIAEEILGLILSPFWFLVDIFMHRLNKTGKIIDYITYLIELTFFTIGITSLFI